MSFKQEEDLVNIFLSLFLYILSVGLSSAYAGIGLDATRIIYNEGEKAVNVSVRNTDSKLNYLIQPSVSTDLDKPDNTTPFVFSPSLFRFQAGSESVIKIMMLNHTKLPENRESLFWFSVKAIPSSEKRADISDDAVLKGGVKIAVGNTIKLIYRPKNLSVSPKEGAGNLRFEKTREGMLKARNESPYYINLRSLVLDGRPVRSTNMMMVPPYGELVFKGITPPKNLKQIQWNVINDNGGVENYRF